MKRVVLIGLLMAPAVASPSWAETVELVTYYPSSFSGEADRLHARRATVGQPYSLSNPVDNVLPDGTLLVAGPVGIGTAFQAAAPDGMLHVVGEGGITDQVLFMPGTGNGSDIRVGIGTETPQGRLHVHATAAPTLSLTTPAGNAVNSIMLESQDAGGAVWGIHTFGDSHDATRGGNLEIQDNSIPAAPVFALSIQKGTGNVGLGTTNPAAKLEVNSTTSGFLPPRMTTAQRNAIAAPPVGLVVYNTETGLLNLYNGTRWTSVGAQVEYFSAVKTDEFVDFGRTTWVNVPGLSVGGVQLIEGDIVRVTLTGSIVQGSTPVGGYGRLRYTFNGTPYGPHIAVGNVANDAEQWADSFCIVLLCGSGAGNIPPGTYTVRLQNLPSIDGPSGTWFNATYLEPAGSSVQMVLEKIRA